MPHLSHKSINVAVKRKIEERMIAMLSNTSSATRKKVFSELLTKTEKLMLAKRLTLIYLISKNIPTHTISKVLKMSPSTVARFEQNVEEDMYKEAVSWLKRHKVENQFLKLVGDLIMIPIADDGKPIRLGKFIDEKL